MKRKILIVFSTLSIVAAGVAQPKIVAHQGYHQKGGASSNSIEVLKMAQKEEFDMVEFDVHMSSDGELLVLHGDWHPNRKAENKVHAQHDTKQTIQSIPLPNGEIVPTFDEWIAQATKSQKTKMLIESKGHDTPELDTKIVKKIQTTLKKYNMQDKVAYLVNHEHLVRELVRFAPKGTPITLSVGSYTPAYCHAIGCSLAGRTYTSWRKHPDYVVQARNLGMKLMAWTVNNPEHIKWLIEQGFDYILTDDPVMMRNVLKERGNK